MPQITPVTHLVVTILLNNQVFGVPIANFYLLPPLPTYTFTLPLIPSLSFIKPTDQADLSLYNGDSSSDRFGQRDDEFLSLIRGFGPPSQEHHKGLLIR